MNSAPNCNRKGSRKSHRRASKPIKRHPSRYPDCEKGETNTSASAKKLKMDEYQDVTVESSFGYRMLNFIPVFSAISDYVKCKHCDSNVEFSESNIRGLGFKVEIKCSSCPSKFINSCPITDNQAYEINKRLVFVMRILGIGASGIRKFCGLMDLPKPVIQSTYDAIVKNIHCAAEAVCRNSILCAATEEKCLTAKYNQVEEPAGLTVSGDGTWQKRGFSSLYGITALIGHFSGKVLDVVIKSSFCKGCETMTEKINTAEYEEWKETHNCSVNHEGSASKMEMDGISEMFHRSEGLHETKYLNYIGDGDSKTFAGLLASSPYGEPVKKKECVGHVQKRMGTRLRNLKKKTKGLGGKGHGKLTARLIDELTVYYGKAIRNSCHSITHMKRGIWATFYHKISTDNKPQHQNCPAGNGSWCSWQKAKAENKLHEYRHKPALTSEVAEAIRPIYEELSSDNLLERCLGGFTQNSNESLNALFWKIAPKTIFSGATIIEIAAFIGAAIFNDGHKSLLHILDSMNIKIGPGAYEGCWAEDHRRITFSTIRAHEATKEARTAKRLSRIAAEEAVSSAEGLLYAPGIAD